MSSNGDTISWRSSRQGGVTLSRSETEFVAASQDDQDVVYLREFLKDFGLFTHPHKGRVKYKRELGLLRWFLRKKEI